MARNQQTLKCVNMVKINEEWVEEKDILPEKFNKIMMEIFARGMNHIGFEREEKADKDFI